MASPKDLKAPIESAVARRRSDSAGVGDFPRGTVIGRYTVLEVLGSGGVATVYSAYDAQLARVVALKIVRPHVDLPAVRRRLFREAQAMARLRHPNVVTVYDVGKFIHQIYIAMEFVDGNTLGDWVGGARPWRETLHVLQSAGRGLAAAHEAGLVHRDFKPDNVLVGNDGRVLVGDFGLARASDNPDIDSGVTEPAGASLRPIPAETEAAVDRRSSRAPMPAVPPPDAHSPLSGMHRTPTPDPLTETGQILGTPGYMAPEHLFSGNADARSDQFSFAVTMYVALYGKHPFAFINLPTYCESVLRAPEPPPASTKVPSWVHAVIERGMKEKPEQRFPSMKELMAALERDPSRRRRLWSMGIGLAAASAIAASAYGRHRVELHAKASRGEALMADTWNTSVKDATRASLVHADPKDGPDIAEQTTAKISQYAKNWVDTHRQVSEATLVLGEQDASTMERRLRCLERGREQLTALTEILLHADGAVVQRAVDAAFSLASPVACASSTLASIPSLPAAPEVRARVLAAERAVAQAQAYGRVGQEQQALDVVARVLPEVRAIPSARTEAELLLLEGESKRQLSDTRGALESFQTAVRAAVRANDDTLAVRAATSIVYVQSVWLHKAEDSAQWMDLAEAIADRAGHTEIIDADLLAGRTAINDISGHPERNVELNEKHIAILKRLYGDRDPRVARAVSHLGVTFAQLGQYESAVKYTQEGIDALIASGGPHNPRLANHYMNLAGAFEALERFDEAKGAFERALALLVDRPPGPLNVIILGQLATVQNELGHADAAFDNAEKAIEMAAAIGEKGRFEWHARFAHAEARGKKSDFRGQAAECKEVVALQRAAGQLAPGVPYWPDALACLAEAELALHQVDAAIAHLEESVTLESRSDAEELPRAQFALAKALRVAGRDPARAQRLAESARDEIRKVAGKERQVAAIDRWLYGAIPQLSSRR